MKRRLSRQTIAVLGILSNRSSNWLYGLEISKLTDLKSGSLYPILIRLAERDLLESRWLEPSEPGRPPRHVYRISAAGLKALADAERASNAAVRELRV